MFNASPKRLFVTGAIHDKPSRKRLPNWQYCPSIPLSFSRFPTLVARGFSNGHRAFTRIILAICSRKVVLSCA